MPLNFDKKDLDIWCLYYGHNIQERFGRLDQDLDLTYHVYAKSFTIGAAKFRAEFHKAEKALNSFMNEIRRMIKQ